MRIAIRHEITYTCERPTQPWLHLLRVTPWSLESQHIEGWRIDTDCDCRLKAGDDAFGNVVDTVGADEPQSRVSLVAQGEVVTTDTAGVLRGAAERFPPAFFLRDTPLTAADEALAGFAARMVAGIAAPLDRLHVLMEAVHDALRFEPAAPTPAATAGEAFAAGLGAARAFAHVFIAAARRIEAPARFVSGCRVPDDGAEGDASHFWAEAHVPGLGWIGFDPVHRSCPHEAYVRIAIGLDGLGAAAVRGQNGYDGEKTHRVLRATESRPAHPAAPSLGLKQEQIQSMMAGR